MKGIILLGLSLLCAGRVLATDKFWQQLTPDERAAAGLAELSAEQQLVLDRLAERYAKEGARQAVAVAQVAAKDAAKVEARAEVNAEVEKEVKKREESHFGFFGAKGNTEAISSRISGTFNGWSGRTQFRLENGQMWEQSDAYDEYYVNAQPGPEVEIRQSGIGGWKLYVQPSQRWVRVKRVR